MYLSWNVFVVPTLVHSNENVQVIRFVTPDCQSSSASSLLYLEEFPVVLILAFLFSLYQFIQAAISSLRDEN